jgi:hypothetical protein
MPAKNWNSNIFSSFGRNALPVMEGLSVSELKCLTGFEYVVRDFAYYRESSDFSEKFEESLQDAKTFLRLFIAKLLDERSTFSIG